MSLQAPTFAVRSWTLAGLLALVGVGVSGLPAAQPADSSSDRSSRATQPLPAEVLEMDRQEELSEQLADAMNGMADALLAEDDELVESWMSSEFVGELPFAHERDRRGPPAASEAVTERHEVHPGYVKFTYVATERPLGDRRQWVQSLRGHLQGWRRMEDVRFKVKEATFDDRLELSNPAKIRLTLQGLGPDGGRRALTCWLEIRVRNVAGRWSWLEARVLSLDELECLRPPFEEVTRRARVGAFPWGPRVDKTAFGSSATGQGGAALDVDRDGLMDVFVPSRPKNHLFRNKGDGTFEDVAEAWNVATPAAGNGVIAFDYDNDGLDDLFMTDRNAQDEGQGAYLTLWHNLGGRFEEVGEEAGIRRYVCSTSAAAADYDNDGLIDLYVCCSSVFDRKMPNSWYAADNAEPNLLFRNLGGGRFEEVGARAGVDDPRWSFAATWADYDEDGLPDLYVSNDFGDNTLYHNDGDGRFHDAAGDAGSIVTGFGMGASWGDYDGDGRFDLYVSNMASTAGNRIFKRLFPEGAAGLGARVVEMAAGNTLLRWTGSGFENMTAETGVGPADWAWGNAFTDVDNDGWSDLFVANGYRSGKSKKET